LHLIKPHSVGFALQRINRANPSGRYAFEKNGADEETRTPDPRITNALLYQLSYIGAMSGQR
jgi:hypothetical protein